MFSQIWRLLEDGQLWTLYFFLLNRIVQAAFINYPFGPSVGVIANTLTCQNIL